ncbi:MAG: hypothetical protein M1820_010508 [Bogoriella megaspora]|nr:MAG: hypothetical protein M1820_010508 [Bogoriella megaspora]
MADLTINGVSFKTNWDLTPAPIEASISKLASDEDPRWISYQTPYHEDTFRRAQSYLKQYVPLELQDPSFLDQWITPSDPQATFTNDDIAFVADISLPILDNYFPGFCTGSHANTIACGLQQKADRENGINRVPDVSSGSYESKAMIMTLASTIEIKKRLPENGVRWLFMRAQAKQIKGGKLSMEVSVLDENGDLVALSSQVLPIIDLERQKRNKQKI